MSRLPDGLIFEYEVDRKGIEIICTQSELIKCKHCLNFDEIPAKDSHKYYTSRYRCTRTGAIVNEDDFCSRAEVIT